MGAVFADVHRYFYNCLWVQHGSEGNAYKAASGVLDDFQSFLYFVRCSDNDTDGACGGTLPYGISRNYENLFIFCAGAMMTQAHAVYVYELDGMAKKMPKLFAVFTVSALALMGVPGLCGFVSKWNLAKAAFLSGNLLAVVGVGGLLLSALLTAIYMLTIVIRAYVPGSDFEKSVQAKQGGFTQYNDTKRVTDPDWRMLFPLILFAVAMFVIGVYSEPFVAFFTQVAEGLL